MNILGNDSIQLSTVWLRKCLKSAFEKKYVYLEL